MHIYNGKMSLGLVIRCWEWHMVFYYLLLKKLSYYSFFTRMRRYFHFQVMVLGLMLHNSGEFELLSNFDFSLLMSAVFSFILKLYFFNIMF